MINCSCKGAGCKLCISAQQKENNKIFIPVIPMGAVRMTGRGKFVKGNAQRYLAYKEHIGIMARSRISRPTTGPIIVDATFYIPLPKNGRSQGRKVVEGEPVTTTPDIDNIIKGLFDSLNKIAWNDDNQVYEVHSRKIYSEMPGIEFEIIEFI